MVPLNEDERNEGSLRCLSSALYAGTSIDSPEDNETMTFFGEAWQLDPFGSTTLPDGAEFLVIVRYYDEDEEAVS